MPREARGSVLVRERADDRTYALRFRAYGERQYVTLGRASEGWTRQRAEAELRHVLADVERGHWKPPTPATVEAPRQTPTFHVFASEWYDARQGEWSEATRRDYLWQLREHLLPFFADYPLTSIDVAAVDAYRERKVRDWRAAADDPEARATIAPASINKTISRLGQILDVALERDLIDRNPVRVNARNRRLKVSKRPTPHLDRAEPIAALLDAAGKLDARARTDGRASANTSRRALLALLVFGGLRIAETLDLRWRHVDLAHGRLRVEGSKTDAAARHVPLLPVLRDELLAWKATAANTEPDARVFATASGGKLERNHTRRRVLRAAAELANTTLVEAGHAPIPLGEGRGQSLTQHALRHTYVSLRLALGHDLASVAQDAGHADVSVTYRIYLHVMRLDDRDRERLQTLVNGGDLGPLNGHHWAPEARSTPGAAAVAGAPNR